MDGLLGHLNSEGFKILRGRKTKEEEDGPRRRTAELGVGFTLVRRHAHRGTPS